MNNDHEPVLAALLSFLQTRVPQFKTIGRRVEFWSKVTNQPALFLRHTGTTDEYHNNIFAVTTLEVELWIYSRAGENPDATPDIALNNLVKAIRNALKPGPTETTGMFTLGGKAFWCRLEGLSEYDPGDIDSQGKAVLPVRITLP